MADRFYLQWNLVNWITVVAMAATAFFVIGLICSALRHYNGTASTQTMTET